MKKLLYTLGALLLPLSALAVQISVPSAPGQGYTLAGLSSGNYQATSTVSVSPLGVLSTINGLISSASSTFSNSAYFSNFLQLTGTSTPSTPPSGSGQFYAKTTQGITRPVWQNGCPEYVVGRDSIYVAKNTSGVILNQGDIVSITGSTGNVPNVGLAIAATGSSAGTMGDGVVEGGIGSTSIGTNSFGCIMKLGIISSLNTSAFASDDMLYVSTTTPGGVVNYVPKWPDVAQMVGVVLVSGVGNGSISYHITSDVHNADTGTVQNSFSIGSFLGGLRTLVFGNGQATSTLTVNPNTNNFNLNGNASTSEFTNSGATWLSSLSGLIAGNNGLLYPTASSTLYGTGTPGQVLMWSGSAPVWAATSTGSGVSTDFSYLSNFNVINAATTSTIWAKGGLNASSTINISAAATQAVPSISIVDSGRTFKGIITSTNPGDVANGLYFGTTGNLPMFFGTNNAERIRILSTGNVGVGTTSPFAQLSIHALYGNTNTTLFAVASSSLTATTTLFSISNTGLASTTSLIDSGSLTLSSLADGCLKTTSGLVSSANCGATFGYDWTPQADGNATSTELILKNGLLSTASSTINSILTLSPLGTAAGSNLAVNASGQIIATTTPVSAGLLNTNGTLSQVEHPSFQYSTSTPWTGTTTVMIQVGYGETFNSVRCATDVGTLGVDFYHASSHLDYIKTASTTANVNVFSTNNTITDGDLVKVDIGTAASSPTKIVCTIKNNY